MIFCWNLQATADLIRANEECRGKTLVHCIFGVSRSVTLCMAYLMTYLTSNKTNPLNEAKCCTMGVYEALDYIRTKRGIARPNPGFMKQLVQFEKQMSETQENIDNVENDNAFNNKVTNSIIELTQSFRSINKENSPV
jgi:hypothetical protein